MNERELRHQGYIKIAKFCKAMDTWAKVCQQNCPVTVNTVSAGAKSLASIGTSYD